MPIDRLTLDELASIVTCLQELRSASSDTLLTWDEIMTIKVMNDSYASEQDSHRVRSSAILRELETYVKSLPIKEETADEGI